MQMDGTRCCLIQSNSNLHPEYNLLQIGFYSKAYNQIQFQWTFVLHRSKTVNTTPCLLNLLFLNATNLCFKQRKIKNSKQQQIPATTQKQTNRNTGKNNQPKKNLPPNKRKPVYLKSDWPSRHHEFKMLKTERAHGLPDENLDKVKKTKDKNKTKMPFLIQD